MIAYFDCNATAPLAPQAREAMLRYFDVEYGNAGSRTHEFGARAKQGVQLAREQVARVVAAKADEVIFTSGATESNNLALLGLAAEGERQGRRHIVTSAIEHKAVLEPCEVLEQRGFAVSHVKPGADGRVTASAIAEALRPDTLLVSVMHVNNETGIVQPVAAIGDELPAHVYLHVDAAQGFGKELEGLRSSRIDLISVSGHKIYGPKGVGALIARRRGSERVPLAPLMFGGGQERGLRPGTLPVPLIAGLGAAAQAALDEAGERAARCAAIKARVLGAFEALGAVTNGDPRHGLASTVNLSVPGIDSEALMLQLKDLVALSNGSACTSSSYEPSHVLTAMGLAPECIDSAIRLSWSHLSTEPDWAEVTRRIGQMM